MVASHLRSLQALELAARTGSLKAAAEKLGITPAALGQRVKALEDFLDVELFVRGRAGLIPTSALAAALPHLKAGFHELETAADLLDLQRAHALHVAAEPDFADLWLKPRIAAFEALHPNIAFSINGEGEAGFRPAPADCEVVFGPDEAGRQRLFGDFLAPIASQNIAGRLAEALEGPGLEGFPILHLDFYRNDPSALNWPRWVAAHGFNRTAPERGIRFRRIAPALEAVNVNSGLAICGLALIAERVDDGRIVLPFPVAMGGWTDHGFQARFRGETRPHVRRFREWLLEEAARTGEWLRLRAG